MVLCIWCGKEEDLDEDAYPFCNVCIINLERVGINPSYAEEALKRTVKLTKSYGK